ncbi:DUF4224 domain-containing protein [Massilia endophytica]|uniref:DUF4224 domain-containing protein n=1 Tax=Massilia endophytica TaxID=2899220 RepID=UPI001E3E0163|nr:DUF4224 domain-containing protein [Massilia endophytica]UGQ44933.1 DUF4224 domain-containing protein [Massilia endophytica]
MTEYLSPEEIVALTHYKRPKEQLETLAALGIPAKRLRDNTVRVMRMHLQAPAAGTAAPVGPRLKSSKK